MIYAQTDRLNLRALEKSELPRLVQLIDVWDIVRWLSVVPFPYTMKDAEEFYAEIAPHYDGDAPEFYALSLKSNDALIGGIGLHFPRTPNPIDGEIEIGYWLGKDYWGQGLMCEAAQAAVKLGFARPTTRAIGATTAPGNQASRKILAKAGLRDLGLAPRPYKALRGDDQIIKWLLTRAEYEQGLKA